MDEPPRVVREWEEGACRYRLVFTGTAYEVQFAGTKWSSWMTASAAVAVAQLGRQVEGLVGEGPEDIPEEKGDVPWWSAIRRYGPW